MPVPFGTETGNTQIFYHIFELYVDGTVKTLS
jgi:hypothetical protein